MTWIKVDDQFADHPKWVGASDAAIAGWLRASAYSSRYLTDGEIPSHVVPILMTDDALAELVSRKLVTKRRGNVQVVNYEEYQRTRAQVEKERESARQRQQRSRKSRRDTPVSHTEVTVLETETETETEAETEPSLAIARPEIEYLCGLLADRIEGNGSKRPTVSARWRDACRLMLDNDGRTVEQVEKAINWTQDDEFWRSNVLSMPKLREKYDQLRLAAKRTTNKAEQRLANNIDVYETFIGAHQEDAS